MVAKISKLPSESVNVVSKGSYIFIKKPAM